MSLPRTRLDKAESLSSNVWVLDARESHHLMHVRRCRIGDEVEGLLEGRKLLLVIEGYKDGRVIAREIDKLPLSEMKIRTTLLVALVKSSAFEDMLGHVTELGVTEIIPLLAERCIVKLKGDTKRKKARWERIIDEATKVSGISSHPVLHEPLRISDLKAEKLPPLRLFGALTDNARPLGQIRVDGEKDVAFAVGPEGDWTEEEMSLFLKADFIPVSLGPNILRTNTAAVAGLSYIILSAEGVSSCDP
ncbi:RsmE family RNA methyltransferase [Acetomicrobium sp.]|uniref:RsmE family RNA methyltransferase n=1 Tax=Acetomicrobium sp. TaxID=1872099 RepID=UPI002FC5D309